MLNHLTKSEHLADTVNDSAIHPFDGGDPLFA